MVLRQIIDEVMYEIRELCGQEYVDEYATKKAESFPSAATGHVPSLGEASPTATATRPRLGRSSADVLAQPADRALRSRFLVQGDGRSGTLRPPWPTSSRSGCRTGPTRELPAGSTAADLAAAIGSRLAKAAVIAVVNGERARPRHAARTTATRSPSSPPTATAGLFTIRHSTAHVLAQAVLDLFPGATFGIGPPVEDGFYYDFELPGRRARSRSTTSSASRPGCGRSSRESQPFVRDELAADDAREVFADHPYKLEIIDDASTDPMSATSSSDSVRTYENPPPAPKAAPPFAGYPGFIDLCRGPARARHQPAPRPLQADAGGRRVLAGRREEPAAPAHLRHGVGVEEGPRGAPRRGSRRRPSATTASSASSSTCSASPTRSARASPCSTRRAASSAG